MGTEFNIKASGLGQNEINQRTRYILIILFVIYVAFHLVTLIYSPLPWFDEVSFLSMTESYMKNGTLFETSRIIAEPLEKLNYGPIYFLWQSVMIKTFGFGIFTVRITNMIFGFLCLLVLASISRKLNFAVKYSIYVIVLTALEPNFNQFLHSGRMDFIGLFFFLTSYITFRKADVTQLNSKYLYLVITGLLLCCSILTNPRFIFAFPVYFVYFIYNVFTCPKGYFKYIILHYALILVSLLALYLLWIFLTFGGVTQYIDFTKNAAYLKHHLGLESSFTIRYNLILILYCLVLALLVLVRRIRAINHHLMLLTLPAIISFVFIVTGGIEGRYFANVVPFVSLIVVGVAATLSGVKWIKYINGLISVCFIAIFVFKACYIFSTIPEHDPSLNEKLITKYIKPNESILGDFEFYYIARNKKCSFQSTESNGTIEEQTAYANLNKTTYFIIKKSNLLLPDYERLLLNNNYELIAQVEGPQRSNIFRKVVESLPYRISSSYDCLIYKRN